MPYLVRSMFAIFFYTTSLYYLCRNWQGIIHSVPNPNYRMIFL